MNSVRDWSAREKATLLPLALGAFSLAYLGMTLAVDAFSWPVWPLSLMYILVPVVPVALCFRVFGVTSGAERRAWLMLALGVTVLAFGDAWWVGYQAFVDPTGPLITSPAGALYALAYVPLFGYAAILGRTAVSDLPGLTRSRIVVELAIAVLLAATIVFVAFVVPLYERSSGVGVGPAVLEYSLSTLNLFVVAALVGLVLESGRGAWKRWDAKVAAAMIVLAAADLMFHRVESVGSPVVSLVANAAVDIGWIAAYGLVAAAALQRLRMSHDHSALPILGQGRRRVLRWYDLAMPLLLLTVAPIGLYMARYGQIYDLTFWAIMASSIALVVLVLGRSVALTAEYGALMNHSVIDALTGAYNHRYFHERLAIEVDRARRCGETLSVAVVDIDDFAQVNDRYGHSFGDQCLRSVASILRRAERSSDTLCRLGSDEFAIIMPLTSAEDASGRLGEALATIERERELDHAVRSASVGIASFPTHAPDKTTLLARADGALYWAQSSGKGSVVVYDEGVVEALNPKDRIRAAEEQSYMQTVESLAAAVDARDAYTQYHSRHVSALATAVARRLGLSESRIRLLAIAGLLHDVGKIGIPDHILRKTSDLTPEEQLKIQEHAELGQRILSATVFSEILPWVLSHHERWDGAGYPNRIRGESIPLESRILAVCDAFDAMVSDRPYRPGMPLDAALDEVRRGSGSQFDPVVAGTLLEMVDAGELPIGAEPAGARSWARLPVDRAGL